jgi:hypothetical protein
MCINAFNQCKEYLMTELENAIAHLTSITQSFEEATPENLFHALQGVVQAGNVSSRDERNQAITDMTQLVANRFLPFAAMISIACGAFVEVDGDPLIALNAVLARIRECLPDVKNLADACDAEGINTNDPAQLKAIGP